MKDCTPGKNECGKPYYCNGHLGFNSCYYIANHSYTPELDYHPDFPEGELAQCDPQYYETNGQKGEKSCGDNLTCINKDGFYNCWKDNIREVNHNCTPGQNMCNKKNNLYCSSITKKCINKDKDSYVKAGYSCDPTFETNKENSEDACNEGYTCEKDKYGDYECLLDNNSEKKK